jgi:hypothetical protein
MDSAAESLLEATPSIDRDRQASLTFVHALPREYLICQATLDRWVCFLSQNGTHVPLRQSMFPVS